MLQIVTGIVATVLTVASAEAETRSEYTTFDAQTDCTVIGRAVDGEGDWADLVCPGFASYPFVIRYGDARESITYGFASGSGMATMAPFNTANNTIEWRVANDRGGAYPFAAIQRWFIARPEGGDDDQVLVVSRVGQPSDGEACVMAYIMASGVPAANDRARSIADDAMEFECGVDERLIDDELVGLVPNL